MFGDFLYVLFLKNVHTKILKYKMLDISKNNTLMLVYNRPSFLLLWKDNILSIWYTKYMKYFPSVWWLYIIRQNIIKLNLNLEAQKPKIIILKKYTHDLENSNFINSNTISHEMLLFCSASFRPYTKPFACPLISSIKPVRFCADRFLQLLWYLL